MDAEAVATATMSWAELHMGRNLFLAGIPASGKSTFGRYLQREHGFVHLDIEISGVLRHWSLDTSWGSVLSGSPRTFVEALNSLGRNVAVNWGFPVHCTAIVGALLEEGLEGWWFDGDRRAARELFIGRRTAPVSAFDDQVAAIEGSWACIAPLFFNRIVAAVEAGPRIRNMSEIAKRVGIEG